MTKIAIIYILFLFNGICFSQKIKDPSDRKIPVDSLEINGNSPDTSEIRTNSIDTSKQVVSDIDAVINYSAKDSLVYDLKNKKVYLYNEGKLTYKDLKLDAGRITVDQETMMLEAYGIPDSLMEGKFIQTPLMFQGNEKYEGAKLSYNFRSQQGNVSMGFSDAEIGYYFGDKIKKVSSDVLFIKDGMYTTSTDREDPEYYFLSPKMKVIPNDKVIAQSVFVYIEGVPVFWIPFGVFPNKSGRSSGIIPPKFGDDATYGQYLSRLGYFWAINKYIDFAATGSYFTKGRVDAYGRFRYASKYNFSGALEGGYSRIRLGESTDIGTSNSDAWNLSIGHNQQLTPTSRFDASLTFTSGINYYNISTNSLSELLQQNIVSNVTYAKTWEGTPFALNANYYRDQNLYNGDLRERIPLINFSVSQTFPFESASSDYLNRKLYEYFSFSYSGSILNNRTKVSGTSVQTGRDTTIKDLQSGVRNTLNLALSPKFEFISLIPYFNYNEIWYNKYITKNFDPSDSSVNISEENAIKALRYFSTGVSLSTKFVGIFTPRIFNVRGIRHTITPALTYNYQPDFSDPRWGYFNSYTDQFGRQVKYSIYEKGVFGGSPSGESQSLAFTLGNIFEMKTQVNDTTEDKFQLFVIDAGINYNFAADSLKFSPLLTSFRTNIGSFLNISGGASFNLYKYEKSIDARVNQFLLNTDGKLANITNFTISMSTAFSFNAGGEDKKVNPNDTLMLGGDYKGTTTTKVDEVSFNIPLSGGLGFNYSENNPNPNTTFRSSNLSGNIAFNLTEKWRLTFQTSYDMLNHQLTAPYITAYRDLNSWEMNFNWYPAGSFRGFSLEVRIKAPQLRDIKVSKQTNSRGVFN